MMGRSLVLGALMAAMVALQGCDVQLLNVDKHQRANWRRAANYLTDFSYAGKTTASESLASRLNSCEDAHLTPEDKCSGHGSCEEWFDIAGSGKHQVRFCKCDAHWAGPECDAQRKSQLIAYFLSMFLGVFGVDQLYLGFPHLAAWKLVTLGGGGAWWLYDLIRIGSAPVLAQGHYKVANDLSHGVFVLSTLFLVGFLGFAVSIWSVKRQFGRKTREMLVLQGGKSLSATPAYGSVMAPPVTATAAFPVTPMRRAAAVGDAEMGSHVVGINSSGLGSGGSDYVVSHSDGYTPFTGSRVMATSSFGLTGSPTATPEVSASEINSALDWSLQRSP